VVIVDGTENGSGEVNVNQTTLTGQSGTSHIEKLHHIK
jgi:hypothetical protein